MKILGCQVGNFGSYADQYVDLDSQGLTLVYGPTGSGKSTLLDMAFWVLYGQTAKNGNVDEVRSWQAGEESTTGSATVETQEGALTVYRTRGLSNDLYWAEYGDEGQDLVYRGKDLKETQALLEARLGVSANLFSLAAYFHEYSPTASFFTAKAKDRREVFEQIANLEMPVKLANKTSAARKAAKAEVAAAEIVAAKATTRRDQAEKSYRSSEEYSAAWDKAHDAKLAELSRTALDFDKLQESKLKAAALRYDRWDAEHEKSLRKAKLKLEEQEKFVVPEQVFTETEASLKKTLAEAESVKCDSCGGPHPDTREAAIQARKDLEDLAGLKEKNFYAKLAAEKAAEAYRTILGSANPHEAEMFSIAGEKNNYAELLANAQAQVNPFVEQLKKAKSELEASASKEADAVTKLTGVKDQVSALSQIYDLSFELRGLILAKSVAEIQAKTNAYLEQYFDSEIKVRLSLEGSDSLEVSIQKSGYECVYRQLSKGQQRLLKLCFGISVMEYAADRAGKHFDNLFLDEALDGLDTSLKLKAFRLFEELERSHSSVFIIDHAPELQQLFSKRLRVEMIDDYSTIEQENG